MLRNKKGAIYEVMMTVELKLRIFYAGDEDVKI